MKRLTTLLPLTLVLAGCGSEYINVTPEVDYRPLQCVEQEGRVSGMLVLLAQSVPTASAVPCVHSTPVDWTIHEFNARDSRARLGLSYGQAQEETFVIDVVGRCELGSATESPSDQPGMRRYDRVAQGNAQYAMDRYYVEPDACTAFHYLGGGAHAAEHATEIASTFGFIQRDALDRQVRQFTDGRLHLDPEPTR